jgi:hypothetical protein
MGEDAFMDDGLTLGRMAELELLTLRCLQPRMLATMFAGVGNAADFFLDSESLVSQVADFARDEEEAAFITNYLEGILRETRELIEVYHEQLSSIQKPPDEAPQKTMEATPRDHLRIVESDPDK